MSEASYELRLLSERGSTILVYWTLCPNDDRAKEKILTLGDVPYHRFEIWRDADKIAEGARFICTT